MPRKTATWLDDAVIDRALVYNGLGLKLSTGERVLSFRDTSRLLAPAARAKFIGA